MYLLESRDEVENNISATFGNILWKCYPLLEHIIQKNKHKANSIKHGLKQHKSLLSRKVRKKKER